MSNKVNCFLIGAQKSGSTALASFMSQHPEISVSNPKATNFFNQKFYKTFQVSDIEEYKRCFDFDKEIICDASDCYHADKKALAKIYEYNPDAKIIIILRDPVKMLISLHKHLLWSGYEVETDINIAYDLIEERRLGKNVPDTCPDSSYLMYSELCSIGEQLEFIYSTFPKENILPLYSSDLSEEPGNVLNLTFSFLGIEGFEINSNIGFMNEAVEQRSQLITKINSKIPPKVKTWVKLKANKLGFNFDGVMRKINGKKSGKKLPQVLREDIKAYLKSQNEKVDSLVLKEK